MQQNRTSQKAQVRPHAKSLNSLVGLLFALMALGLLGVPGLSMATRALPAILVVAGYLSTCVIAQAHAKREGLGIGGVALLLWQRLRYVWPSLLCVVAVTCSLCAVLSTSLLDVMRPDVLPALGFFSNWTNLFASITPETSASPLAAFWFVGVEMQLFFAWLLILALLLNASKTVARRLTLTLAVIATAWLILQCVLGGNLLRVSLATDAYACSYLLGAWLAFAFPLGKVPTVGKNLLLKPMGRRRHLRGRRYQATTFTNVTGFVTFAGMIALVVLMPKGGALVQGVTVACVSLLAMILCATIIAPGNLLGRAISIPPLAYLGSRALGLYLWFWPLYRLIAPDGVESTWYLRLLVVAATVAATEVSYRLVELPFAGTDLVSTGPHNIAPYRLATTALVILIATGFGARALLTSSEHVAGLIGASESSSAGTSSVTSGAAKSNDAEPKSTSSRTSELDSETSDYDSAEDESLDEDSESSKKNGNSSARKSTPIDEDTVIYAPASETRAGKYDPVLIGDSVPGDADWSRLPDALIDSYIGRLPFQALEVARGYMEQDAVGHVVILACFSNDTPQQETLDEFAELFGDDREIYLVGTVNPDGFMDAANQALMEACERHENMHYIDWPSVESGHDDEYLWADMTHVRPEGGVAYVQMVIEAIAEDLIDAGGTTE